MTDLAPPIYGCSKSSSTKYADVGVKDFKKILWEFYLWVGSARR